MLELGQGDHRRLGCSCSRLGCSLAALASARSVLLRARLLRRRVVRRLLELDHRRQRLDQRDLAVEVAAADEVEVAGVVGRDVARAVDRALLAFARVGRSRQELDRARVRQDEWLVRRGHALLLWRGSASSALRCAAV